MAYAYFMQRGGSVAIVVALLAGVYAHQQTCADKVSSGADEPTSLLQTFQLVNTRSQREALKKRTHAATTASTHSEEKPAASQLYADKSVVDAEALAQPCVTWMPLDLRILHHGLRIAGLNPPEETCDPGDPMFGMMDFLLTQVSSVSQGQGFHIDDWYYILVPAGYVGTMAVLLSIMLLYIIYPSQVPKTIKEGKIRRPEAEAWERGYINWLFVDWVTEWIGKWGTPDSDVITKITCDELDEFGEADDEVSASYNSMKFLWEQEVDRVGLQQANVFMVVTRFIGHGKIMCLVLFTLLFEGFLFLGPPLAMAWVIRFIEWLYVARFKGEVVTYQQLVPATILCIILFQGLPVFIAVSNSVSNMIAMRICVRVCGGLSSLVFKKGQQLPLCSLDVDTEEGGKKWDMREDAKAKEKRLEKETRKSRVASGRSTPDKSAADPDQLQTEKDENSSDDDVAVMKTSTPEQDTDTDKGAENQVCSKWGHHFAPNLTTCSKCGAEQPGAAEGQDDDLLVFDEEGDTKQQKKFNLVQLVSFDISDSISILPLQACRLLVMIPICMILFCMLYTAVGMALVVSCFFIAFTLVYIIMLVGKSQFGYMTAFYFYANKRLIFVEDMLFNIRTVKAFGWEGIMEERIYQLRSQELEVLWGSYKRLGTFFGMMYQFPRAMILISLWGHVWLYGSDKPLNIFATLPVLFTFQTALMQIGMAVPPVLNSLPSLQRVEQFLKLPEAPLPRPEKTSEPSDVPPWVNIWPEAETNSADLKIQGSFTWRGQPEPDLKDLNLSIPAGSTVAILGKVGSGKSSLLNAMIGELYPVGDARISIPTRIAYSSQTPYICEGTLKENIIYGEPYNEERYNSCVFATSLIPDIQVLPGGDQVPIGSRGISLSGGQRARVAMARAAYNVSASAVIIDDPFAAVDSRTARHLLDEFVHGDVLRGRTKVIVCQPDPERIQEFDKVIILHKGRVVVDGAPKDVMHTSAYQNLLNQHQRRALERQVADGAVPVVAPTTTTAVAETPRARTDAFSLREDESEIRPDWGTITYFLDMGGKWYLGMCVFLFLVMMIVNLMMGIVLQTWASDNMLGKAGLLDPLPRPVMYLWPYLSWWSASLIVWVFCWSFGMLFTINLSRSANQNTMKSILHAPVDKFFDRTPVGRIMNRMSTDLMNIDTSTFNKITQMISIVWTNIVPITYLHLLMPLYFTCASIPFYYLMFLLVRRFWSTMVPMRYLTQTSKSHTDTTLTEVEHSNAFVRASRKGDFRFEEFQKRMKNQLKVDASTQTFLKRWLVNRLFLMMGFFICCMVVISIWVPNSIDIGGIGLCLAMMFQLLINIEADIENIMFAQFQFISMKRLHDYAVLDQEADYEKETDLTYKNFSVRIKRAKLGKLERQNTEGGIIIVRKRNGFDQKVLEQTDQNMFMAPQGFKLLDPTNADLKSCANWHRLVAVNGKHGSSGGHSKIETLVEELCRGKSSEVALQIQSGWMLSGASLVIKDLVAAYGDIGVNVLHGVNLEVSPHTKVGVVGTTGCGKSTLLLCILRILEPKGGTILLNGVDASSLGLKTLRTTVGLVPQDPVLMQCSVRDNLDPFGEYDDDLLWRGLELVLMKEHVSGLVGGLAFEIQGDGGGLSFGQRQLLCMARMVIRQPALILLDEATSALDPATQQQVQHTVEKQFPHSTMVMIAHRLETIGNFDKVVVMDKGKIAEQGPPAELRQIKNGIFTRMWEAKQTW